MGVVHGFGQKLSQTSFKYPERLDLVAIDLAISLNFIRLLRVVITPLATRC